MSELSRADERFLEKTAQRAFHGLDSQPDLSQWPSWRRTFVMVYSFQGVIDNGGFQYAFERDWPGKPPYREIADAYRAIGAIELAGWLEEAAALFPFPDPHLHQEERCRYLREFCRKGDSPMGVLSWQAIEASEDVFAKLVAFARAHPAL